MENAFTALLKQTILNEIAHFKKENANNSIYGLAIIMGQAGNYLGLAFATANGLEKIAAEYFRPDETDWKRQRLYSNIENLKQWLKWANPDDGWHYIYFTEKSRIDEYLEKMISEVHPHDIDTAIEKGCIEILRCMEFQEMDIVFGITHGENPEDFLKTATMINTYEKVKQLWADTLRSNELDC